MAERDQKKRRQKNEHDKGPEVDKGSQVGSIAPRTFGPSRWFIICVYLRYLRATRLLRAFERSARLALGAARALG